MKRLRNWLQGVGLLAAALCVGCSSVNSTLLTRDESNVSWEQHTHLKGIPITLNVPTHLKLYVFEKHYLQIRKVGNRDEIVPVEMDIPVRDFAHEILYTDKIFTVDFKRPAAGSANTRVDMNDNQYFKKIQHDVTDETVTQLAGLLGALTNVNKITDSVNAGAQVNENGPQVKEITSLVAVAVFELDDPQFEEHAIGFLNCHLNKAHDAWVVPPKTGPFRRVGVKPHRNTQLPYPEQPYCKPTYEPETCWPRTGIHYEGIAPPNGYIAYPASSDHTDSVGSTFSEKQLSDQNISARVEVVKQP